MIFNIFRRHLIEIFDTVTGNTLFYVRLIPQMRVIERYIALTHRELKNWDYRIVL